MAKYGIRNVEKSLPVVTIFYLYLQTLGPTSNP